jgi:hypothetical protein
LAVVIDLALAVGAVFLVMLPVAVALERRAPLRLAPLTDRTAAAATAVPSAKPPSGSRRRSKGAAVSEKLEPAPPATSVEAETPAGPRRLPGVSGRRRVAPSEPPNATEPPRRPGVSGRRRGGRRPGS